MDQSERRATPMRATPNSSNGSLLHRSDYSGSHGLCNIVNRKRASGNRARRLCFLLAFALIVFVPRPPNPNLGAWFGSFRLTTTTTTTTTKMQLKAATQTIGSSSSSNNNIGPGGDASINHHQYEKNFATGESPELERHQQQAAASWSFVLPASAFYLDQVGQISRVLSEFVDVLLEKVSFLAEIIIESSLEEECEFAIDSLRNDSNCAAVSSLLAPDAFANAKLGRMVSDQINFDELEYTNLNVFKDSIISGARDDSGPLGGASKCRLFSLSVQTRDLPLGDMDSCCGSYATCYSTCGRKKLDCDQEFRQCLRDMCKRNFDFTSPEVVARHLAGGRSERSYEPLVEDVDQATEYDEEEDDDDLYAEEPEDDDDDDNDNEDEKSTDADSARRRRTTATRAPPSGHPRKPNDSEAKRLKDKYKACKLASKVMVIGNLAFGCQIYKQSQSVACCDQLTTAGRAERSQL